jgi:hypothetical protein
MRERCSTVHGVPRRHRGNRIPITIRLPFDLYREVSIRARARNWSMSDYIGWCVAKELSGKYVRTQTVTEQPNRDTTAVAEEWIEELSG